MVELYSDNVLDRTFFDLFFFFILLLAIVIIFTFIHVSETSKGALIQFLLHAFVSACVLLNSRRSFMSVTSLSL